MEFALKELVKVIDGAIVGEHKLVLERRVAGTCAIDNYMPGFITFVKNEKWGAHLCKCRNAMVIVPRHMAHLTKLYPDNIYIVVENVAKAMIHLQQMFYSNTPNTNFNGISSCSKYSDACKIGLNVTIADNVYIGSNVTIGNNVTILNNAFIMDKVTIGDGSYIYPNVTIFQKCKIGKNCLIHPGAVIGADGFRMEHDYENQTVSKMIHAGNVIIGDNVEIGVNNSIARATLETESTKIADNVKLDGLVHIGHNAIIGEGTTIAAQSCIGGSSKIGKQVWIGTGANISNGVKIGDNAKILLNAVVAYDVAENEMVSGFYAMPHRQWKKAWQTMKETNKGE